MADSKAGRQFHLCRQAIPRFIVSGDNQILDLFHCLLYNRKFPVFIYFAKFRLILVQKYQTLLLLFYKIAKNF